MIHSLAPLFFHCEGTQFTLFYHQHIFLFEIPFGLAKMNKIRWSLNPKYFAMKCLYCLHCTLRCITVQTKYELEWFLIMNIYAIWTAEKNTVVSEEKATEARGCCTLNFHRGHGVLHYLTFSLEMATNADVDILLVVNNSRSFIWSIW